MFKAHLKDRWWSLAAAAGMGIVWALMRPPYWKILAIAILVLLPLSYLGYIAWPEWRTVTPRRRASMFLGAVGASLLAIGERVELLRYGSVSRGLSLGIFLLGCALMIVAGLRHSDD